MGKYVSKYHYHDGIVIIIIIWSRQAKTQLISVHL